MPESISEQTRDNAFLQRILAHQSDKRRVVNEAMARVMSEEPADPVIDCFLEFLAQDMAKNLEKSVVPFPEALLERAVTLTAGVTVDLDAEIEASGLTPTLGTLGFGRP
ncbi:type II toxin-antitoxin system PrlF family antitoxin [Xanthobacter agilis]|uniref:Uncharacterized protein n=1 Tax=Xanthobacter agilis TaxID=47492 RepID=A0ABU0LJM0_XANAG|nr:type II toxin-antitoxin system PrlF family antitoxin [Xanthobacter agilis]MDQ0507338.1 hypothetical protein [Xanthobacter agilis]